MPASININAEDLVSCKVPEDSVLETRGKKIGRLAGNLLWGGEDCDFYFTTCQMRRGVIGTILPAEKIIVDFYAWDTNLTKFYDKTRSVEFFQSCKKKGIQNAVELDFSVWYDQPRIVNLYQLYNANKRTRDLVQQGMKILINGNLLHADYFDVWDLYLPKKINSLVFDNNHTFNKAYIAKDLETIRKIYDSGRTIKNLIFIDGKKDHSYLRPIIALLEKNDCTYTFIPPRIRVMQIFTQQ